LDGEYKIIVGARSAIFAPIKNLGLIVVDEEHESSYKQTDSSPKYHARDVAIMRAKFCNANVILGSATPSLESMYNAETGKYRLLKLPNRVAKRPLPYVSIVDIKEEYKEKNYSIFSRTLQDKIYERLIREEQIILFLNKRGFSSFVQCKKCGHTIKCQNCEITLTYHRHNFQLLCHYCDYQMRAPDTCPECGSEKLNYKGTGTQKVEDELEQLFPKARILRMDFDTTSRKGAHDTILQKFGSGKADILLGTQMVAKGLDFPNVTLVGVISADISLNIPDFRSSERTFQLLSQVAGRAGRGELGGEVVVQTMIPKHYSILFAQTHDYNEFYQFELGHRKQLAYPPFTRLVRILLKSEELKAVNSASDKLVEILTAESKPIEDHYIQILGPAPAPLSKIRNFYRWQILIKALNYKVLHQLIRDAIEQLEQEISLSKVKIEIDIDAQDIM
jgi:primosomal protein N' (replication factor Y)